MQTKLDCNERTRGAEREKVGRAVWTSKGAELGLRLERSARADATIRPTSMGRPTLLAPRTGLFALLRSMSSSTSTTARKRPASPVVETSKKQAKGPSTGDRSPPRYKQNGP